MSQNPNFDEQAAHFDQRAGLPPLAGHAIAAAVADMAPVAGGATLLEIGAGTGQIGGHLLQISLRYVGLDISGAMLEVFRQRVAPIVPNLLELDANLRWPADDHGTNIIFSSRTLHLLDSEHVVREFFRVAAPGGAALIGGRTRRESNSIQTEMRMQMRLLLRETGVEGRAGEQKLQMIFDNCCTAGAIRIEPRVVYRWFVERSPSQAIESWQGKEGLAGTAVSEESKKAVLARLRDWAVERYGDLEQLRKTEEEYVLEGVRLP